MPDPTVRIFGQTQTNQFHSDICFPVEFVDHDPAEPEFVRREFLHDLLDEWLDAVKKNPDTGQNVLGEHRNVFQIWVEAHDH